MTFHHWKRARDWLRRDLAGMNRPSTIGRTLRRHPVIFGRAVKHFLILITLYTAGLAALGRLGDYREWLYLPFVMTGIYTGGQIKVFNDRDTAALTRNTRDL